MIDTNVMLVCISSKSTIHKLFLAMGKGEIKLCVTNEIITEYLEVISKHRGTQKAYDIIDLILGIPYLILIIVYYRWNLISIDPDDNKFVDCAIAAGADYIITEDRHFEELKKVEFPNITCIGAMEFIEQYLKA